VVDFRAHVLLVTFILGMLTSCGGSRDSNSGSVSRNNKNNSNSIDKVSRSSSALSNNNPSLPPATIRQGNNALLPPSTLSYGSNEHIYVVGQPIDPLIPQSTGGIISSYETTPLPLGLNLNSLTGVISGTPVLNNPRATYAVTGKNNAGRVTTGLTLSIQGLETPPTRIYYSCTVCNITLGEAINPLVPTITGGQVNHYTVAPSLPADLMLHPTTGIISGTITAETSEITYTITASNNAGSITTSLKLVTLQPAIQETDWPSQPN
jgi:hypothetical protein